MFSGGVDSTTLLYHLLDLGHKVKAISFDYGQRHKKELEYAGRTCLKLNLEHQMVDIRGINLLLQGSSLTSTDIDIPEGVYDAESMKNTVVPNRNMIFLALAGALAVSEEADLLAMAVHAGDHEIYPDCRPSFIESMQKALSEGNYHNVRLYTPYVAKSKAEIMQEGLKMGIDYDRDAWSCYKGEDKPCGVCGTCRERDLAMGEALKAVGRTGIPANNTYL